VCSNWQILTFVFMFYVDFSSTRTPSFLMFSLLFSHRSQFYRRHSKIKTRNSCSSLHTMGSADSKVSL